MTTAAVFFFAAAALMLSAICLYLAMRYAGQSQRDADRAATERRHAEEAADRARDHATSAKNDHTSAIQQGGRH